MVTHSSTSRPVQCLCMAERTGCPVLTDLWSYVLVKLCLQSTKLNFTLGGELLDLIKQNATSKPDTRANTNNE
jgi:hypothetical protein